MFVVPGGDVVLPRVESLRQESVGIVKPRFYPFYPNLMNFDSDFAAIGQIHFSSGAKHAVLINRVKCRGHAVSSYPAKNARTRSKSRVLGIGGR
ncbi:MAG: hypothetical protein RKO24_15895, partial [Candidatus Competibacter sp.]|nr:hypothetical protein [Candidatus Competibacter sp.]